MRENRNMKKIKSTVLALVVGLFLACVIYSPATAANSNLLNGTLFTKSTDYKLRRLRFNYETVTITS